MRTTRTHSHYIAGAKVPVILPSRVNKMLEILVIEDSEDDYILLIRELTKAGFLVKATRVDKQETLRDALLQHPWDLVISDNMIPGERIDIQSSFHLLHKAQPETPFIILSGTIHDNKAVEYMNLGVSDYILKSNLIKLIPVVRRILNERELKSRKAEMETRLIESDERFRLLAESILDMFLGLDQNFRCTFWNTAAEKWTGISATEAIGKNIYELFPHIRGSALEEKLIECITLAQPQTSEIDYQHHHRKHYYQVSIYPSPEIYSVIVKDITKNKNTEAKLIATNEELETFMYRVSHDIRGPVASLLGLLHLVQSEQMENSVKEYVMQAGKMTNRLDEIVRSLTDVIGIRQEELRFQKISMNDLYRTVEEKRGSMKQTSPLQINFEADPALSIISDLSLLTLIFDKLIQNAFDYRRNNVENILNIKVGLTSQSIRFIFQDNGMGIPDELQGKVYTMFYRGNINSKGSGLGLYLVKIAVEKLGGTIELKSKPSEGTTFTLRLPNQLLS